MTPAAEWQVCCFFNVCIHYPLIYDTLFNKIVLHQRFEVVGNIS